MNIYLKHRFIRLKKKKPTEETTNDDNSWIPQLYHYIWILNTI